MKSLSKFLLFTFAGLLFNSCKKETPAKQFPYQPIPQEVRDYMWFDIGSFWIYEDSATQILDTIKVYNTEVEVNPNYNQETPITHFEILSVYAKSNSTGCLYEYHAGTYSDLKTNGVVIKYFTPDEPKTAKRSEVLTRPFIPYKVYIRYPGEFTLIDTLSSYVLNGKTYSNVKVYYHQYDGMMDFNPTKTWVAPNYGIIKKQCLSKPKTFWLKTSSIIKMNTP